MPSGRSGSARRPACSSPPDSVGFDHLAGTDPGAGWAGIAFLLSVVLSLNLVLAVLNLFPFPPLDGSGAAPAPPDRPRHPRATRTSSGATAALGIFGILIAWQLFSHVFDPVFLFTLNLLYPGAGYH